MSDLYALSDEELLNTDISSLVSDEGTESTPESTENDVQHSQEQSDIQVPEEFVEPVEENTEQSNEPVEVDYEAFYQSLTKPFKANGREVQISNADDAIRLMQMGANYSKKMEALKPQQALIKALETNGYTSKEQLGYLIDLANKKPEAIAKLVKESNIDLYDFDVDQADSYQPTQLHEPTQFESVLNEVVETNPDMYSVISDMQGWDSASKDVLYANPQMLKVISEQQSNGMYSKIVNRIANEKLFGRMQDLSFLEAYAVVEQEFSKNNGFTAPRPNQTKTDEHLEKKKQAGIPTGKPVSNEPINFLSMTDEEILKLQIQ